MVKQSGGGCSACSAGVSVPLVGGYRGKRTTRRSRKTRRSFGSNHKRKSYRKKRN